MKKLLLISTLFFGFISCSDDHELIIKQTKLLKITEETYEGGDLTSSGFIEYKYGDNNFVNELIASGGYSIKYIYDFNNQIIKIISTDSNGNSGEANYSYTNGLITTETSGNGNSTINYFYNNSNQLTRISGNTSNLSVNETYLTYDTNENVVNIIYNSEIIDSFEYDNKPNPFRLLFPSAYSKIKHIGNNNVILRNDANRITTYKYNSNNYPVEANHSIDLLGIVKIREFFYN